MTSVIEFLAQPGDLVLRGDGEDALEEVKRRLTNKYELVEEQW